MRQSFFTLCLRFAQNWLLSDVTASNLPELLIKCFLLRQKSTLLDCRTASQIEKLTTRFEGTNIAYSRNIRLLS